MSAKTNVSAVTRHFLIGITVALTAAWLAPEWGAKGGPLHADRISKFGIMIIFFIQGIQLPGEQLLHSLRAWRLHLYVQTSSTLLFPLITWLLLAAGASVLPPELRIGFLYLAILPTTISSAVVMVTAAGGDLAAALFNTALSNLLGVFIVPAAAAWLISSESSVSVPVGPLLWTIVQLLLLPLVAGQLLRRWLKDPLARRRAWIIRFNNGIIFFIVYAAFCDSFAGGAWQKYGAGMVLWAAAGALVLLLVTTALVWYGAGVLGFNHKARITALFCASQKTLAAGVPLAGAIFQSVGGSGSLQAGIVLLPLMFYHPMQLTLGGFLLPWLNRETT